ncbi:MAG: preprotein translocase subunit SecG [Methylococcales bacterium]
MYQALIIVHVLLAVGIIALVLLQQGRGADAGAAFGSGASGTVFGAQGSATFLTRLTAALASLFFATSLGLAVVGETREFTEGFMDTPAKPIPTDLPPGQVDTNPTAVSDMPQLPSGNNGATNAEATKNESGSPPVLDEAAPQKAPAADESRLDQPKQPVPAESEEH